MGARLGQHYLADKMSVPYVSVKIRLETGAPRSKW